MLAGEPTTTDDRSEFARRVRSAIISALLEVEPRLRACARVLKSDATAEVAYLELLDLLVPDVDAAPSDAVEVTALGPVCWTDGAER